MPKYPMWYLRVNFLQIKVKLRDQNGYFAFIPVSVSRDARTQQTRKSPLASEKSKTNIKIRDGRSDGHEDAALDAEWWARWSMGLVGPTYIVPGGQWAHWTGASFAFSGLSWGFARTCRHPWTRLRAIRVAA